MSRNHSAEWLRGAVAALEAQSRFGPVSMLERYRSLLAEAEAREALQGSKEKIALSRIYELASRQLAEPAGAGDAVAMAKICTEVESVHLPSDASAPTAADLAVADELDMLAAHIQEYIGPDDARDDIRRICRNRAQDLRRGVKRAPTAAEVIAAAEKALRCGKWEHFTPDEREMLVEALAAIAKWKEAQ